MPTASIERAAPAARSSFWMPPSLLGYDDVTGPPFLGNQHDTVRCGFLPRRSYVAPSRRSRGSAKRARKELTYCPIYGFKPCVICAKDLTPALFCCPFPCSAEPTLGCPAEAAEHWVQRYTFPAGFFGGSSQTRCCTTVSPTFHSLVTRQRSLASGLVEAFAPAAFASSAPAACWRSSHAEGGAGGAASTGPANRARPTSATALMRAPPGHRACAPAA